MKGHLETLHQIVKQDLEPEPEGGGGVKITDGVAEERRISIEDGDIHNGRKLKSKLINGYKVHVASDLDEEIILACAVTPANRPEEEVALALKRRNKSITTKRAKRGPDPLYTGKGLAPSRYKIPN